MCSSVILVITSKRHNVVTQKITIYRFMTMKTVSAHYSSDMNRARAQHD